MIPMPPINAIAIAIFDSVTVSIGDDIYSSDMSPLRQRKLSRYGRLQQKKKEGGVGPRKAAGTPVLLTNGIFIRMLDVNCDSSSTSSTVKSMEPVHQPNELTTNDWLNEAAVSLSLYHYIIIS
jgi:hypothetical protein